MKYLLLILVSVAPFILNAQTEPHEHHFGCHFTKNKLSRMSLTDEERAWVKASKERSDTFDILNYRINLDLTKSSQQLLEAETTVFFTVLQDNIDYINLDLERLQVYTILSGDDTLKYKHAGPLLTVYFPDVLELGETYEVTVKYGGTPMTSASGFGGFYFESGYAYNLGIGLQDKPHNYGRAWFPCFDNFVERATYEINIETVKGVTGFAVGTYLGEEDKGGTIVRSYSMNQPLPTYLVGVAASNYDTFEYDYISSVDGKAIPVQIISKANTLSITKNSFINLDKAMEAFEYWYGPYIWERIGYVMVSRGAMEHSTCIAYPDFAANGTTNSDRLMAHELCHHWWGNVVTLSTSHNMWIKEGNSEYGAHLFFEYKDGPGEFYNQVENNFFTVMNRAKNDDGAFLALSPMPETITYGVHTYNKGASTLHAMRKYMGDEAFKEGQRAVLKDFEYQSIDAYQYRDKLKESTGVSMVDFFDDWIFQPGFAAFEIDSVHITQDGEEFILDIYIEQKLRGKSKFMHNVPLSIYFFDKKGNKTIEKVLVSGQNDIVRLKLPFEPFHWMPNPRTDFLPLSGFNSVIGATADPDLRSSNIQFSLTSTLPDENTEIAIEHLWVGPDPVKDPDIEVRLSSTHYWKVGGFTPESTKLSANVSYNRVPGLGALDLDLVSQTEDSLILMFRKDASRDWLQYPYYTKIKGSSTDGAGIVRIDSVLFGEYCFANGVDVPLSTISGNSIALEHLTIFPNPAAGRALNVSFDWQKIMNNFDIGYSENIFYEIIDMQGKIVQQNSLPFEKQHILDIGGIGAGLYILILKTSQGQPIAKGEWIKN